MDPHVRSTVLKLTMTPDITDVIRSQATGYVFQVTQRISFSWTAVKKYWLVVVAVDEVVLRIREIANLALTAVAAD